MEITKAKNIAHTNIKITKNAFTLTNLQPYIQTNTNAKKYIRNVPTQNDTHK